MAEVPINHGWMYDYCYNRRRGLKETFVIEELKSLFGWLNNINIMLLMEGLHVHASSENVHEL